MTRHDLVVPSDLDGSRADRVVAAMLDIPRSDSRAAFDQDGVVLGGETVKPGRRMAEGEVLTVSLAERAGGPEPDPTVRFGIAHEDADVLVVDKPIDLVVHPTSPQSTGTLVHGLLAAYPEVEGVGQDPRWGIVHRLDRDTSGLLVVARTPAAYEGLTAAIRERVVRREYLAMARGRFDAARGTIEAPIARDPRNPTRMVVDRSGRDAVTHYRRAAVWDDPEVTLLDVTLETGRTHQIRVHLAAIDHPIVGDPAYGVVGGVGDPGRPWLHARRLAFDHPVTGDLIDVTSPLPDDLADSLAAIGPPTGGRVPA